MTTSSHVAGCPKQLDDDLDCLCNELLVAQANEDQLRQRQAEQPSAAEMLRRAKAAGHVDPQPGYV